MESRNLSSLPRLDLSLSTIEAETSTATVQIELCRESQRWIVLGKVSGKDQLFGVETFPVSQGVQAALDYAIALGLATDSELDMVNSCEEFRQAVSE